MNNGKTKVNIDTGGMQINVIIDNELISRQKRAFTHMGNHYYQLRGRPVTKEQALDIIRRTDDIFFSGTRDFSFREILPSTDYYSRPFRNRWFQECYGWVRPDGFVGINDAMGISASMSAENLVKDWVYMLICAPYLDIVVGITHWTEYPDDYNRQIFTHTIDENGIHQFYQTELEKELSYKKVKYFTEHIETGVWIHDKTIEIMTAGRTADIYNEYERLYEGDRPELFSKFYCRDNMPDIIDYDYMKKCVTAMGYKEPEKIIEKVIEPYMLKNMKGYNYGTTDYESDDRSEKNSERSDNLWTTQILETE